MDKNVHTFASNDYKWLTDEKGEQGDKGTRETGEQGE